MGLFGKVKGAVKKGAKKTYKSVVKPVGRRIGRDASSTYRGTAGRLIRPVDVTPRQAYNAARRASPVTGFVKVTRTLRKQTGKAKKARPRR